MTEGLLRQMVVVKRRVALDGGLQIFPRSEMGRGQDVADTPDEALPQRADASGIVLRGAPTRLELRDGGCHVTFFDGSGERFDTLYPVLGADAQSALAQALHAGVDNEIAEILGISETKVATKISRIKQKLRGQMTATETTGA